MMLRSATDAKPRDLCAQFSTSGVAVVEYYLTPEDLARMDAAFPSLGAKTAGARADAFSAEARDTHTALLDLASRLLQGEARLSRLQAFDKSPAANWFVPWHQDRAEDGRERDVALLERTVALRIHLDDCDETNGPLEVVPGSHVHGRLEAAAIANIVATAPTQLCLTVRGDIVAMRPLLLHRSQRAQRPAARRVVHIEFAAISPRESALHS
jgi:ectoine hydroxylase-related dioxygenase (phytanoyl-CoA dioxygenase family)